ncbi:MAG: TonB-dependent receptor, partial [Bacteroidota bacterium]|nr:TonB-dependent receptor [Bacteroidota bacterium]
MNSFKKVLLAMLFSFAFAFCAHAQKLEGTVKDATGKAIDGASIIIKGSNIGTTSEADGTFAMNAKANDVLVITALGYAIQELKVAGNGPLLIVMKIEVAQLDQIVLLGSRGAGRVKTESPVPVDVISLGNNSQTAARPDLTSLLNYAAPSFNYNKQSGGDGADHVDLATLRGLGPDQTLVLVNGKRWHQTAFVALFGTRGRGNSGTDL